VNNCASGTQRGWDRAISHPYNYIRRGKSSEKVSCSVRSTKIETGAALINVITVTFGETMGWGEVKSVILWGHWFPKVFSSV